MSKSKSALTSPNDVNSQQFLRAFRVLPHNLDLTAMLNPL
jgi:hypothetical protein